MGTTTFSPYPKLVSGLDPESREARLQGSVAGLAQAVRRL